MSAGRRKGSQGSASGVSLSGDAWVTVVELPSFIAAAAGVLTDDEVEALKQLLATSPEVGKVIPGTGGVRKVRVGVAGRGKRGGSRVIYYFRNRLMPLRPWSMS